MWCVMSSTKAGAGKLELLVIVPHPDDEVFSAGGLLCKMESAKRPTGVLTLTKGAAGRTLGLCEPQELPAFREREWHGALDVLGVGTRYLYDFPDGGLADVPASEVCDSIAEVLQRHQPEVIVTFPPNGSNGHPDHVATHVRVMESLEQLAQQQDSYQPERLYYYATETPYAGVARADFLSSETIARLHLAPSHYVDMQGWLEQKLQAMGHYETQARSVVNFMRVLPRKLFHESFHRAKPEVQPLRPVTRQWL